MAGRRKGPGSRAAIYAGYTRVSRQGTREDERFRSPAFQRELINRFAKAEGLTVQHAPPEVDVSGSKARRAILDGIVAAIERGELAGLVVAKLDRLSRLAPRDRVELFERIESAGGAVLSASEQLDVSTPEGRFARDVFLGVARMQWEKYRDGFEVAKVNAIEQGIAIKPFAPYGYRFDSRHALELVADEAAVVRELFELRAGGASFGVCLEHFERASGRSSSRATMKYLLENRAYLGELHYGREAALVNEDAHPAIVELELFELVQAMNRERGRAHGRPQSGKAKSLLAGIARCATCGRGLRQSTSASGRSRSYKCPSDARHCSSRAYILARELDAYVIERVLAWAGPTADELVELELELGSSGERIVAEHRLGEAERLLLEWSTDLEREEREPEAYKAGLRAREQRVERRRQELAAMGEASRLEVARSSVRAALVGEELSVDERRRLLGAVLEAVVVRRTPYRGAPACGRAELRFASATPEAIAQDASELVEQPAA